ncbi:hypothetical protein OIU78_026458 [Salix suchowensis]|nr:hypothetical protein OIU78_026458 [Salix suchowensis]
MASSFGVRKGAWTEEEDILLRKCVEKYGEGRWFQIPLKAADGNKKVALRNYRITRLKAKPKGHAVCSDLALWSLIAGRLPGRTANDVKNYWNTNLSKKVVSSSRDAQTKPEAKSITKHNIIKPRPRNFKNLCWLRAGKGTPFINVGSQYGDDLCKPYSTTAFPPSDINEIEAANQEPIKNIIVEDNPRGGIMIGDVFFEHGKNCWDDIAFDADLWNLINTEIDQQGLEGF